MLPYLFLHLNSHDHHDSHKLRNSRAAGHSAIHLSHAIQPPCATRTYPGLLHCALHCSQDVGANNKASTVFLSHAPGTIADVGTQIRSAFMEGHAGSSGLGGKKQE